MVAALAYAQFQMSYCGKAVVITTSTGVSATGAVEGKSPTFSSQHSQVFADHDFQTQIRVTPLMARAMMESQYGLCPLPWTPSEYSNVQWHRHLECPF